jgi:hypothetical protein
VLGTRCRVVLLGDCGSNSLVPFLGETLNPPTLIRLIPGIVIVFLAEPVNVHFHLSGDEDGLILIEPRLRGIRPSLRWEDSIRVHDGHNLGSLRSQFKQLSMLRTPDTGTTRVILSGRKLVKETGLAPGRVSPLTILISGGAHEQLSGHYDAYLLLVDFLTCLLALLLLWAADTARPGTAPRLLPVLVPRRPAFT